MSEFRRSFLLNEGKSDSPPILYIYNYGDTCDAVSGGYVKLATSAAGAARATSNIVYNSDNMAISWGNAGSGEWGNGFCNYTPIKVDDYKTVHFLGKQTTTNPNNAFFQVLTLGDYYSSTQRYIRNTLLGVGIPSTSVAEYTIDISELTGYYNFGCYGDYYLSSSGTITLYSMWLTKD